jgi:hypothetical protein
MACTWKCRASGAGWRGLPSGRQALLNVRNNVGGVHVDDHGTFDEVDREDQAAMAFSAQQDAIEPGKRAASYSHTPSDEKVGMRLRAKLAAEATAQSFNFPLGKGGGHIVESDETHHAGNFQDAEALEQSNTHENVTGKKRELQMDAPILPAAHGFVCGKKMFHAPLDEVFGDTLFAVGAGVSGIPARFEKVRGNGHSLRCYPARMDCGCHGIPCPAIAADSFAPSVPQGLRPNYSDFSALHGKQRDPPHFSRYRTALNFCYFPVPEKTAKQNAKESA